MKSAAIFSLGCVKNLVDSEVMVSQLLRLGYVLTPDPSKASLILVNTCGFVESAVQEAINTILDLARHKTTLSCKRLVVAGCMVQRYGKKLLELMPEVDCFLGVEHSYDLEVILADCEKGPWKRLWISSPRFLFRNELPRFRTTPPHTAYVKIAEGCSNHCTYCLIPHLRGPLRSRSVEDILQEARRLAAEGVREINLIAQDTTAFGLDRKDPNDLIRLLESLDVLDGVLWIRLLYAHPNRISVALLRTMAQSSKMVPYLDIPFQHCVPKILESMGRTNPLRTPEQLVDLIRHHIPDIALRTSLMVGFPGETEAEFRTLREFVCRAEFDHLGVFEFSPESGAPAARFFNPVGRASKSKRRMTLLELQRSISRRLLASRIGQVLPVLIEGLHPETDLLLRGRLATQAPEIDGTVIVTKGQANVGDFVLAQIKGAHDYDLEAEIVSLSTHLDSVDGPKS